MRAVQLAFRARTPFCRVLHSPKSLANAVRFVQACLNAPEPASNNENGVDSGDQVDSPEEPAPQHLPPQNGRPGMPQPHMGSSYMPNMPMDPQQALAYQGYVQRTPGYASGMPPQPGMPPNTHHQS